MKDETFAVSGMHCASCASIIGKRIGELPGVASCEVNPGTEQACVSYDEKRISLGEMNKTVEPLGYTLHERHSHHNSPVTSGHVAAGGDHHDHAGLGETKEQKITELKALQKKVYFSFPVAIVVFLVMLWDIISRFIPTIPPLPFPGEVINPIFLAIATVVQFWIGKPFVRAVATFIRYRVANMDTLIGIGTMAAYVYSAFIVLFPAVATNIGLPHFVYFDVAIVVIGFVTLGKYLEARSKLRTGEAIEKLIGLQAKMALVIRDGKEIEIPISEVILGETIIVKPGMKVPVDGEITSGASSLDESMITGESIPVDKKAGDLVIGSTINKQGNFKMKATKIGADTMLAQIIAMVEAAQGSKAPIQALADKISSVFVPIVLGISLLTLLLWLTLGAAYIGFSAALSFGLLAFVGILVIACPCALGLATPTAIIVGVGRGALRGILVKDAESLEKLSHVNTIVFDKTGTITEGQPIVTDIVSLHAGYTEEEILRYSASIESYSEHPLAEAIVKKHGDAGGRLEVHDFRALEGVGVEGRINGNYVILRKPDANEMNNSGRIAELQYEGKTVVVLWIKQTLVGLIAISDTLRRGAPESIERLRAMGISVVLLTGDNKRAAAHIAKKAHIDEVIAEVLPQEKADHIKRLQSKGRGVAMVGDGVNDAPALTVADVGIAMATGTDVAIESAGIMLLHGDITKVVEAVDLARMTMRTIKQNLFWAFIYNMIGIPLAAGIFYPIWGIFLNPIFAGIAMAGSSVSVVGNSLRLKTKKL